MATKPQSNPKPPGPVGLRTASNLKEIRNRIPVRELSRRMAALGRPVVPSGITKIEMGTRRVDVDDLVALAVALDTTPNRLLLDPVADDHEVELTADVTVTSAQSWDWATGAKPLPDPDQRVDLDLDREILFSRHNRPNEIESETSLQDLSDLTHTLLPVENAVREAMEAGVSFGDVIEYLRFWDSLESARRMVESHPKNPANKTKATAKKAGKR